MNRTVTLLSDYGYRDEFAGVLRLVIDRLAPGTPVLDLTHGIPAGDVRRGALALEAAVARSGPAVHLAVVDPGVGTNRRGVAIAAADGSHLVGPDNGLLGLATARLGGAVEAVDISASPLRAEAVAPTFHGRDVFAPVAAHLAAGHRLAAAGSPVDPGTLVALDLPAAVRAGDALLAHVLYVDGFGNVVLDARPDDFQLAPAAALSLVGAWPGKRRLVRGATFADGGGSLVLYDDSSGRLGIALDGGDAASALGLGRDDELRIEPR